MLRLQVYVLRRLFGSLALILLVVGTVFFLGQTVALLARTPDVGPSFVLSILPALLPVTLSFTLPLAFLVALTLTYGRMADDQEVLAARMAGFHPWVVAAPGIFAGVLLSLACLHLQGTLVPRALGIQKRIEQDILKRFVEIVERGARTSFVNRDFKLSWTGVEDGDLVDVRISKGGVSSAASQEIRAARGRLGTDVEGERLLFTLRDVVIVTGDGTSWTPVRVREELTYAVSAEDLFDIRAGDPNPKALTYAELLFRREVWPPGREVRWRVDAELFGRAALALAPFAFALCGVPLALLVGRGSRAAAALIGFGIAMAFYLLKEFGASLASRGSVPAAPAILASDALLAAVGVWLLRRVARS